MMQPVNIDIEVLRETLGNLTLQSIMLQSALKAAQQPAPAPAPEAPVTPAQ